MPSEPRAVEPWWVSQVHSLLSRSVPGSLSLGQLWRLRTALGVLREQVPAELLDAECPELRPFEVQLQQALEERRDEVAAALRTGQLSHEVFRSRWESLGFDE